MTLQAFHDHQVKSNVKIAVCIEGIHKWGLLEDFYRQREISYSMRGMLNGMLKLLFAFFIREGVYELKLALCVWTSWDSSVAKATTNFEIRVNSFTECTVSFNKLDSSDGHTFPSPAALYPS